MSFPLLWVSNQVGYSPFSFYTEMTKTALENSTSDIGGLRYLDMAVVEG